jgi:tRNA(Ile)-lysidine synthase TilS/MesJ
MLLVFTVYFGIMAFIYSQIVSYAKKYEEESLKELEENYNMFNISNDNILYKTVYALCSRLQILDDNMVIVCCTGDEPSMALLSIVISIYGRERVFVYTLDHYKSDNLTNFISNICEMENISYNVNKYNSCDIIKYDIDVKNKRYSDLKKLTEKLNTNTIFEAHTLESSSNEILDSMFSDTIFINKPSEPEFIFKPFYNIPLQDTYDFIEEYNIPIDCNETHIVYSMVQPKHIFDHIEDTYLSYYPNWRINLVKSFKTTNYILNQYNTNINTIINNSTSSGTYGFIYYRDIEIVPFDIFKRVINGLCDNNNISRFSNNEILKIYTNELINMPRPIKNNNILTLYVNDLFLDNLKKFEEFINKSEPKDFYTKYTDKLIMNLQNNYDITDDYIIFSVNIMTDEYKFKIEENLPSNYREQLLEGIVYIKVSDNCFTLYTILE